MKWKLFILPLFFALLVFAACEDPQPGPQCGSITPPPDTTTQFLAGQSVCFFSGITYQLLAPGFGDANNQFSWSNGENTGIIYTDRPGVYTVTITDSAGQVSSELVNLNGECAGVYIPNSFSPNGDQINDEWLPIHENVCGVYMEIRDLNGTILFSTNESNVGWDGTYDEQDVTGGTYLYFYDVRFINGETRRFEGPLELLR